MSLPLPADHPFWSMANVALTPHVGGAGSTGSGGGIAAIFDENLQRWRNGQSLLKVVVARSD